MTELKAGEKNILVAVQLDALKTGIRNHKVNRIVSLYGKNKIKKLLGHNRLYWNKAKARIWTGNRGLQLPTAPYPERASARKILKPEDLVKYKMERGLSFSMERADLRAPDVLMGRADERAGAVPGAGEIEARNVQSRMGWPMAERKELNILDWGMRMF